MKSKGILAAVCGYRTPALGVALSLLAGCFSGSGSSSRSAEVSEGVFVDSAVTGLSFVTASQKGKTDGAGVFKFKPGEQVSFSVGGIDLGSAAAQDVITPLNLVPDADLSDAAVLNISRLLQSLDADGNLVNGIQITSDIDQAIADYVAANRLEGLDFSDTDAFEDEMEKLFTELNQADLFSENANDRQRGLRGRLQAWQHLQDSLAELDGGQLQHDLLPVLFIHGGAGSASQFKSQAQRFRANGYPLSHIAVYEYDTSATQDPFNEDQAAGRNAQINVIIDELLTSTGADKVNLVGHSNGTRVSLMYLRSAENAAKVNRYVSIDGTANDALPGNRPTLALWGQYIDREVTGAENVYPPENTPVGHIEVATSAQTFERMFRFFNEAAPATSSIPEAAGETLWIAGKTHIFPENIGAAGTTLQIYETDSATGMRLSDLPVYEHQIDDVGEWGPVQITKGATYEYALLHDDDNNDQYFYREGYRQDNLLIRLNTSLPGAGVGQYLHRSPLHTNISIGRDKELWGDQGASNDQLTVNGTDVVTELTAPLLKRLSNIFLHDRDADQISNLSRPDPFFHLLPFMSGLDLFLSASAQASQTIEIKLTPRGGGAEQVINVPNWPSDKVRSVSVMFRDYAE